MRRVSTWVWAIITLIAIVSYLALAQATRASQTGDIADSFVDPITNTSGDGFTYGIVPGSAVPEPTRDTCYKNEDGDAIKWRYLYHAGHDYMAPGNTDVVAVADGIVKYVAYKDFPGSVVIIEHELDENDKVYTMYGHLVKRPNDPVDPQL